MWVATSDEEANFIFDLNARRENQSVVLDYARWLDERDPLGAEYLRLELSTSENQTRLQELRQLLDPRWLGTITARHFRPGDVVRITGGKFAGFEGSVRQVDAVAGRANIFLHIFYRPSGPSWVAFPDLQLLRRAPENESGAPPELPPNI